VQDGNFAGFTGVKKIREGRIGEPEDSIKIA
jgi:hypothetical protein